MRELEARFHEELVVIGVHSAKYTTEKDDRHLAATVSRNGIDHPVINDGDMLVWQQYAVRAWPTLMFVDPAGKLLGKHEGEFLLDDMAAVIEQMIAEFDAAGILNRDPVDALSPPQPPDTPLAFPAGIHVDAAADRLYIADTSHHRIVIASLNGQVQQLVGSGRAGMDDGPADSATFDHPHGIILEDGLLYVADTGNHAIRRIDPESGLVTTVAGTGQQAYSYVSGGPRLETDLNSPWDVVVLDGVLYIAMAGNHQLWMHRLGSDEVRRFAGTGHEGIRDGTLASGWLAQPSGITRMGTNLIFSDAETSSIRAAGLAGPNADKLTTLVGTGLFDWGDTDGPFGEALLQHATGVAVDPESGLMYVCDTYNNKIKRLDPQAGTIRTWLGAGPAGNEDGSGQSARFFEPHTLGISAGSLYIADTNNHAIRRADLATGDVTTIELHGL